ncbi:MAG TPA: hypothetical protein VIU12_14955 [Chryseolinea sp.]
MELDEMKALWTEMSAKLEGQKKLTDKMIIMMTQERYQRRLSKIRTPELISTGLCFIMVLMILFSLNKFETPYLLACAIASATILSVLPVLSLLAIRQVSRVDIKASNYKEVLLQYTHAKRRLLSVQKLSFYLTFVLLIVALPVAVKIMGGKTIHIETGVWLWYLPLGFLFYVVFARWVYRCYVKVTVQLEDLLREIGE